MGRVATDCRSGCVGFPTSGRAIAFPGEHEATARDGPPDRSRGHGLERFDEINAGIANSTQRGVARVLD